MKPRRGNEPSSEEIRLRTELDRARRELTKLKKAGENSRETAEEAMSESVPTASTAPEPVAPTDAATDPEVAAAEDGGAESKLDELGHELELERERLHWKRLLATQLEEGRRLAGKQLELLRALATLSVDPAPTAVAERALGVVESCLGFRIAFLRLRAPGTNRLEAAAFRGLSPAVCSALEAEDVLLENFLSWLKDEFRIGRCYLISHKHSFSRHLPPGHVTNLGKREPWEWHGEDALLVPLSDAAGAPIGYLSVNDPEDRKVPGRETLELLEALAQHTAVAIENARRQQTAQERARELEQAGQRAQEIQALKSNFVSTISHELRTPLAAIRAYVDTLLAAGPAGIGGDQLTRFLGVINDESQRLARLIESVLDLSRFDSGKLPLRRQAFDLAEVIEETLWLLRPMAAASQVNLKIVNELADTSLDADRDQIRQLVLHLGSNAVKFTPAGGQVELRLKGDAETVTLEVEDTGIGIPSEALEKVFDRFYQVDSSLVRRYGGTGLGLAICKSIVDWHGGRVTATSTPERGSCFTARLPRSGPRVMVRPGSLPPAATEDLLRLALEMVSEVMNARVVSLMAPEPGGDLVVQAAIGLDESVVRQTRVQPGQGISGWVAEQLRPLCSATHAGIPGSGRVQYNTDSFLSVPLEGRDGLIGVLNVADPAGHTFDAEDCNLLLDLADRIAQALEQARALETSRIGVEGATDALRHVLEHLRVSRTSAPDRVRLAQAIARELHLPEAEVSIIGFAATVHDVGMTLIGRDILAHRGALSDDERRQMQRHVELGADLLRPLETLGAVRDVVLSHHEWWDGTGYPRGIGGEDIPIGARLLAVVDAYESMTHGRAHRPPQSRIAALSEIHRLSGRQFDPTVVEAFERALPGVATRIAMEGAAPPGLGAMEPAASRPAAARHPRR
jgi:signal transduction histidine kinase